MIGHTVTHYRILEKLGEGGMGVVYKAEDTKLKRNVALKFFPSDLAAEEAALARFVREAQAAAALDHPNICPVYEIHDADDAVFIAMGYVDGSSLRELLTQAPLPVARALDLVIQVATGLEAAHERGVVHRDIKPANIMVSAKGQVRITDFGLAQWAGSSRLTRTGTAMGTTAYMSPEQTRGETVDHRSDIWSLGVVLYEAFTGRRPFQGDIDAAVVYAVLMDEPAPVSSLRDDVPEGLDRIVNRALAKDPAVRYQHIGAMRQDLIALTRPTPAARGGLHADAPSLRRPARSRRPLFVGSGLLLLAATVVGIYLHSSIPPVPDPVSPVVPRRSVAVLGFENRSLRQEAAWLSTALSEMLSTTLSGASDLRTLPGEVVSRMETELALSVAEPLDGEVLSQIRLNVGADLVVQGTYAAGGAGADDPLEVALQVHDARTGETLAAISETGMQRQLFDLVAQVGRAILVRLGTEAPPPEAVRAVAASLPRDLEATRLYAEGLEKLRRYDVLGAVEVLEQLIVLAPDYPMAYSALGRAWAIVGDESRARTAAEHALARAAGLSREQQLLLQGAHYEAWGDWPRAVETYQILYGFFPDNLEYGLRLARTLTTADRAEDALGVVAQLRHLPPPASQDARIDLAEGAAAKQRSDFEGERIAAVRARMKATTQGAGLLVADAWYEEGWALWNLGEPAKAVAAYQEARTHYEAAGLRGRTADMMNAIAIVHWDEGRLDEALAGLNAALAIKRETGQQGSQASIFNNISNIYKSKGELDKARTTQEEALTLRRALGDGSITTNLSNMANILRDLGDLEGAEQNYREAIAVARRTGRAHSEATALMNLAELQHTVGDLAGARAAHEAALRLSRAVGRGRDIGFSLWGLGRLSLTEDDLPRAVALYDSAVVAYRSIEYELEAQGTALWLAEAYLEQGKYDEAEAILGPAVAYFRATEAPYEALVAEVLQARLFFEQDRPEEARQAVDRINTLAEDNQDFELGALIIVSTARIIAAEGQAEEALRRLRDVVEESERRRFVGMAFDARLALGEIEQRYGDAAQGERLLQALAAAASASGFALIARKAAGVRRRQRQG